MFYNFKTAHTSMLFNHLTAGQDIAHPPGHPSVIETQIKGDLFFFLK